MDDRSETVGELPKYLQPLLEPRPSGEAKLLAAWDGLCTEHQILLLDSLGKHGRLDWTTKIRAKALATPNAYVRYLAARGFHPSDHDADGMVLWKRIGDDPEPLVRHAPFESAFALSLPGELSDPEAFFALSHEARLAIVRSCPFAEYVVTAMRHAIQTVLPAGKATEDELAELLLDCVANAEFKSYYDPENMIPYDGWAEQGRGKDIEALWSLVPDLPNHAASVLIRHLPERSGMSHGIPGTVLNGMPDWQLELLFWRRDIDLRGLRKNVFFHDGRVVEATPTLVEAAVSHNFDLEPSEFAEILNRPEEERARMLLDLARYASDLSLCIFQAVKDVLSETEWSEATPPRDSIWPATTEVRDRFERKLAQLRDKGYSGRQQLYTWALYEWAKRAVPWKKGEKGYGAPGGDFEFLNKCVKVGDTWGTFIAFSEAWKAEASKVHFDAGRKAIAQTVWQMIDTDLDDERKKILEDLGITKAGEETEQEAAAKRKPERTGRVEPTAGSKTPMTMIWDWLRNSGVPLRTKVKFISYALGIFSSVFVIGTQSTRFSVLRDLVGLPPTWDSALLRDSQIQAELSTLSEMRSILDDIPSGVIKAQLVERMKADAEYRGRLTGRLVRLLGIRNEKMDSLKPSLVHVIDARLEPLYTRELGTYTFRAEKTEEFVACVEDMKGEIQLWEQELLQRREKLSR
jgi:hypothetical protein